MNKKILILGDSFCHCRDKDTDWPRVFVNEFSKLANYDFELTGQGFPGCSWWPVRNLLMKEIIVEIPYVLIMCHTDYLRIPTVDNSPGTVNSNPKLEEIYKFIDFEFYEWAFKYWYKELDDLLETNKIPYVLHLKCFEDITPTYQFKNGVVSLESLDKVQYKLEKERNSKFYRNHFDEITNKSIGYSLAYQLFKFPHFHNGLHDFQLMDIKK